MTRQPIRACEGKEPANTSSGPWAVWADALFVSILPGAARPPAGRRVPWPGT
jgi:hypothetical protein